MQLIHWLLGLLAKPWALAQLLGLTPWAVGQLSMDSRLHGWVTWLNTRRLHDQIRHVCFGMAWLHGCAIELETFFVDVTFLRELGPCRSATALRASETQQSTHVFFS